MLQVTERHIYEHEDGSRYSGGMPDKFTPFTEDIGELFRSYRSENGRCTGKVYIDTPDGTPDHIGWVFEKKRQFDDYSPGDKERFYLDETWVIFRHVLKIKRAA